MQITHNSSLRVTSHLPNGPGHDYFRAEGPLTCERWATTRNIINILHFIFLQFYFRVCIFCPLHLLEASTEFMICPSPFVETFGQTRGTYGQMIGTYGQTFGTYGQTIGTYGQMMGTYGQTIGAYGWTIGA